MPCRRPPGPIVSDARPDDAPLASGSTPFASGPPDHRLLAERTAARATYVGDMVSGAWARKPA